MINSLNTARSSFRFPENNRLDYESVIGTEWIKRIHIAYSNLFGINVCELIGKIHI